MEIIVTSNAKLLAEHITVGRLLWYSGQTSMWSWDCPAVITEVDQEQRLFLVRSLDDMKEQSQAYTFDVNEHSPTSRKTMRLVSESEVKRFLAAQEPALEARVARHKKACEEAEEELQHFKKIAESLFSH